MICPACHRKDTRVRIEMVDKSANSKAWKCHVCGAYCCLECGNELVADKPLSPFPMYEGETSRLHRCSCQKMYLVV